MAYKDHLKSVPELPDKINLKKRGQGQLQL